MRVVFIGTGEIGVPTLRMLQRSQEHKLVGVITQPDKPAGRDQRLKPSPIKLAVRDIPLPLLQPKRIKSDQAISEIRALAPDLIVVMAYGQILPRSVLNAARIASLNLHASLLPRWRGAAPIQAAIAAGDRLTGITIIYMDEGLDTGDILLKRETQIDSRDTAGSLHTRLAKIAPDALAEAMVQLSQNRAARIPQENALATYAPKLEREHGRIDWDEAAEVIERKIRAFNPWPGAFTQVWDARHNCKRTLKVFAAAITGDVHVNVGTAISLPDRALVFGAGKGALALLDVHLEGSRRMTVDELVRGHPWIAQGTPGTAGESQPRKRSSS
ncbi:MAG: methionyl-tRNA formyltransferase [Verrucomicrobia bacterium]|nr:MAG: methionyl-tRNA formyltransferase [Verrucomicrobiota bacterium]